MGPVFLSFFKAKIFKEGARGRRGICLTGFTKKREEEVCRLKKKSSLRSIARYLKGSIYLFVFSIIFSMLNTVFNALTPQIIRITVDSVIGEEPFMLPQAVKDWLHLSREPPCSFY